MCFSHRRLFVFALCWAFFPECWVGLVVLVGDGFRLRCLRWGGERGVRAGSGGVGCWLGSGFEVVVVL